MQTCFDLTEPVRVNIDPVPSTLEEKEKHAIDVIQSLISNTSFEPSIASSFGKDSSVLVYLALKAMRQLKQRNVKLSTVYIIHSDTTYENPEIAAYAKGEIKKLRAYAISEDLPLKVLIASPNISNDYIVQMIGGRTIATFFDSDRKCQQYLKRSPLKKLQRVIEKDIVSKAHVKTARICALLGLRLDESVNRKSRMQKRNDNDSDPVWNETSKQWTLSPIANYTTDDVFETIGRVRSGLEHTYSDFENLVRVYRDSAAGECMVNIYAANKAQKQTACGSRHGCWCCTAVASDSSMENFLKNEEYAYMRPLNQLREYIVSRHYDWNSRNWLARSVNDKGMIAISPNSYSPEFCLQLLRYALTIDVREQEWAYEHQTRPRFQILSLSKIIAIDALWNRYSYHRSLQACQTYKEIFIDGVRYDFPDKFTYSEKKPLPKSVTVPFADEEFWLEQHGLFDTDLAVADPDSDCGNVVNVDDEFTIDEEGADLFFQFELERALDFYHNSERTVFPASGLNYLLRLGVISIFKNGHNEWNKMLRIGNQMTRHNLREILNKPEELIKKLTSTSIKPI